MLEFGATIEITTTAAACTQIYITIFWTAFGMEIDYVFFFLLKTVSFETQRNRIEWWIPCIYVAADTAKKKKHVTSRSPISKII